MTAMPLAVLAPVAWAGFHQYWISRLKSCYDTRRGRLRLGPRHSFGVSAGLVKVNTCVVDGFGNGIRRGKKLPAVRRAECRGTEVENKPSGLAAGRNLGHPPSSRIKLLASAVAEVGVIALRVTIWEFSDPQMLRRTAANWPASLEP